MKLLLSCEVIERGVGRVKFRMLTNFNPDLELIKEMQAQLGFRPLTFGGPWLIKIGPACDDNGDQRTPLILQTTWSCCADEAPLQSNS